MPTNEYEICERLELLRVELFGHRGKSEMARRLNIRPSTYDRYERDRIPPADLLVKVAAVCDVTLEWLMTGGGPKRPEKIADIEAETLTRQFKELLIRQPDLRPVASGFMAWADRAVSASGGSTRQSLPSKPLIPIVGRLSSFATHHSLGSTSDFTKIVETAREFATSQSAEPKTSSAILETVGGNVAVQTSGAVAVVSYQDSTSTEGVREYLDTGAFGESVPDAIGWLVDDDAMEPQFRIGDIVLISPSSLAIGGQPCIASTIASEQVFLRMFHREGREVVLVPSNSRVPVNRVAEQELRWAYRVLALVRRSR